MLIVFGKPIVFDFITMLFCFEDTVLFLLHLYLYLYLTYIVHVYMYDI